MPMQHGDHARRQPGIDRIAYLRYRNGQRWQHLQRPVSGLAVTSALADGALERGSQIVAMTAEDEIDDLAAKATDHAAGRLPAFERPWTPYQARSADREAVSGKDCGGRAFGIGRL
jgi:hypothetical protein